jgi:hypothetical protein
MASSPETAKDGINEPKVGIDEKDPATALGEWYVQFLSMRSLLMISIAIWYGNKRL